MEVDAAHVDRSVVEQVEGVAHRAGASTQRQVHDDLLADRAARPEVDERTDGVGGGRRIVERQDHGGLAEARLQLRRSSFGHDEPVVDHDDPIRETVGAYASMVLAEGEYTVIAKNRDRIYQRDLTVVAGENQDVEVLATEEDAVPDDEITD